MFRKSAIAFIAMTLLFAAAWNASARGGKGNPERRISGVWVKSNPRGGVDTLDLAPNGRFELILDNGATELFGHYDVTGGRIIFNADGGRDHCKKTGIYRFDHKGRELRLFHHDDPCPGRERMFTGRWLRR